MLLRSSFRLSKLYSLCNSCGSPGRIRISAVPLALERFLGQNDPFSTSSLVICSSALHTRSQQISQSSGSQNNQHKQGPWKDFSAFALAGLAAALLYGMRRPVMDKDRQKEASTLFASVAYAAEDSSGDDSKSKRRSKSFNFLADAVETAAPAVVYIEVTSARVHDHFFRSPGPTSSGSGFIANEKGMVITNAHVVADAQRVKVKLRDGREFDGIVVETDQVADLAAVKILSKKEEKFPHLELGESSNVRAGEWVAALGSPLQLTNTITAGIVSTLHRAGEELGLPNRDMSYIQTDAAINVGNSGGPLVNLDGEVIGINCITVQAASGISFAIPSNIARKFLEGAEAKVEKISQEDMSGSRRRHERHYIGITMLTLTPAIVEELRQRSYRYAEVESGVFVPRVSFRSPAERAGMMSGDVIVSINGQPVLTAKQVYEEVRKGEQINVEVLRGSKTLFLTIQPSPVGKL